mmetsp:Transcript_65449/g.80130  ORF Transcript_65449/g.80130 Transcript_65449/m.80130 type:complete len:235 (-) Transcript_65449:200-904(-)
MVCSRAGCCRISGRSASASGSTAASLVPLGPLLQWQLSTVRDDHLLGCASATGSHFFNLLHHLIAFHDFSEDDMFAIQVGSLGRAEEELRAVGVGPCIGHGEDPRTRVLQLEAFIFEFLSIDRLAACAVVIGEVATLAHEVRDDSMEGALLVAEALLPSAQRPEVLRGLGHHIAPEHHDHTTRLLTIQLDVEEAAGAFGGFAQQGIPLFLVHILDGLFQGILRGIFLSQLLALL